VIRAASVDDAAALAGVQTRAWAHGFADFMSRDALAATLSLEQREERWRQGLADPATATWVWEQGGAVVAFASIGPSHDEDAEEGVGELVALYVDPHAQGAGLGGVLLDRAVAGLRERGFRAAVLWTFEDNGLARRLYQRRGWTLDRAGVPGHVPGWPLSARYRREL
jgi:GNAT superfamily N-acetyltransferase